MVCQAPIVDRKSTRLNSSHTVIYTLSLHDALPIFLKPYFLLRVSLLWGPWVLRPLMKARPVYGVPGSNSRSEEHTSELQSHSDLHSFPTRRSSDLSEAIFSPSCQPPLGALGFTSVDEGPACVWCARLQ